MKILKKSKVVAVSGGFDPLHIGHIRYFKEAKKLGDKLVVILNSDRFLKDKKGYIFMAFKERKELIESIGCVDEVIPCIDKDYTTRETMKKLRPDIAANGGDRKKGNIPEVDIYERFNIKMVFGVGGKKVRSSSRLIEKIKKV